MASWSPFREIPQVAAHFQKSFCIISALMLPRLAANPHGAIGASSPVIGKECWIAHFELQSDAFAHNPDTVDGVGDHLSIRGKQVSRNEGDHQVGLAGFVARKYRPGFTRTGFFIPKRRITAKTCACAAVENT